MKAGYIKIHRKMLDNPVVMKDSDHVTVWLYLLLNAAHASYSVIFNGKRISLQPGQLITGRRKIAEFTGVNESKVKRILNDFKIDQQIDQQSCSQNTLITVVNWHKYQISDQQNDQRVTNERPTSDQRVTTNNNINNINNINNNKKRRRYSGRNYDFEKLEKEYFGNSKGE